MKNIDFRLLLFDKKNMLGFILLFLLIGCSATTSGENIETVEEIDPYAVEKYDGEKSDVVSSVYTTKKEIALTFNGMADKETMEKLLLKLEEENIKATFFLPGMRVAEEPDIAKMIQNKGHEIENNTLNQVDISNLSYQEIYKEIKLSNEIINDAIGVTPQYVRSKSGEYNEDFQLAAAHAGMEAVVYYSANPQDWDMKSAKEIADYLTKYITRGGIITLNTDINPAIIDAIPLIADAVERVGYNLVTLEEMVTQGNKREAGENITGYDAAVINNNYKNETFEVIEKIDTDEKVVALTFDDWGTDYKISEILEILKNEEVPATFFLRANGVEANPNLAKAIADEGHDIANHTYTHPVITEIDTKELQEEVVKAHQVLTEAIQEQPLMIFRPPTGAFTEDAAKAVAATGYKQIVLYDVTALDWKVENDAKDISSTILEDTENGSIILLHLQDELHTSEALPIIINELKKRGFTFVKLSEV